MLEIYVAELKIKPRIWNHDNLPPYIQPSIRLEILEGLNPDYSLTFRQILVCLFKH